MLNTINLGIVQIIKYGIATVQYTAILQLSSEQSTSQSSAQSKLQLGATQCIGLHSTSSNSVQINVKNQARLQLGTVQLNGQDIIELQQGTRLLMQSSNQITYSLYMKIAIYCTVYNVHTVQCIVYNMYKPQGYSLALLLSGKAQASQLNKDVLRGCRNDLDCNALSPKIPHKEIEPVKAGLGEDATGYARYCLHISGPKTRHMPLHLLQP